MSTKADVMELKNLKIEIKRVSFSLKTLRDREKIINERLTKYLTETKQIGVKYANSAIILEKKTPSAHKKKKIQESDTLDVLRKYGVSNPEQALKDITKARKGSPILKQKIKLQNL